MLLEGGGRPGGNDSWQVQTEIQPSSATANFSLKCFLHVHLCVQTFWKHKQEQDTKNSRKNSVFQQ